MLDAYRLIIFDADDTLRRTTVAGQPCPHSPDEWELMPNVREALGMLRWDAPGGPRFGIASNQDHVGYGYLSIEQARGLLRDVAVAATGIVPLDPALQLCPHVLEEPCRCRKPRPTMLLRIMEHYGIGPDQTVFIGNADSDRRAARGAGVAFIPAANVFDWTNEHGLPPRLPGPT